MEPLNGFSPDADISSKVGEVRGGRLEAGPVHVGDVEARVHSWRLGRQAGPGETLHTGLGGS